jgi:hypothetical protein
MRMRLSEVAEDRHPNRRRKVGTTTSQIAAAVTQVVLTDKYDGAVAQPAAE